MAPYSFLIGDEGAFGLQDDGYDRIGWLSSYSMFGLHLSGGLDCKED